MDLSVREKGNKVKSSTASSASTASEQWCIFLLKEDIEEVIFEAHTGISFSGLKV